MTTQTSLQSPSAVVLIRPHRFAPNQATAIDNAFQAVDPFRSPAEISRAAYAEVTAVASTLIRRGVRVHLFEDEESSRPDSVFPNNWFSTHPDGRLAVYPMFSPSRRTERRPDVLQMLESAYRITSITDYSQLEDDGVFLEGTGAMVLDHRDRVAYTARSNRADPAALLRFCGDFGYEPFLFDAVDEDGVPIYHTNVLMCVGTTIAMVGLGLIVSKHVRDELVSRLEASGRTVIDLSIGQVRAFAGNAIELHGQDGPLMVMSARAVNSLTSGQRDVLERQVDLLPLSVPTIELAGGSVRCMIAGVHAEARIPGIPPIRESASVRHFFDHVVDRFPRAPALPAVLP